MFRVCCANERVSAVILIINLAHGARLKRGRPAALSRADIASAFRRRSESIIMNDDGSAVITERVCSRTKEHNAMDTESDGNAALNMENDLMMADEYGEAMSLQPSVVNARATQMFT